MIGIVRRVFAGSPTPETARAIVAAQRASLFHSYEFQAETLSIDPETASLQELEDAISDCRLCLSTEYPETEEGCGRAIKIAFTCREAIKRRFSRPVVNEIRSLSELTRRVELAIAAAAYPEVHPDFTDAGWKRMAEAAVTAICAQQMIEALRLVNEDATHRAGRITSETLISVVAAHNQAVAVS